MKATPGASIWRRLAWLVALWSAGVLALGLAAWLLKQFMRAAGLAS
ncbi:DUF2474 family protein [Ramlibacter sp.]|nr:DUF2474 family protein [Ramlibacter sp.]HYD75862.1 DUF2474 family protein [Ramlibacter sp.]